MKNIVCPVSQDRIPEHLPRIIAFFTIALFLVYIITGFLPLLLILFYDFMARGLNRSNYSILFIFAKSTSKLLHLKSQPIDKAPKLFAARIGAAITGLTILSHLAGLTYVSISLASLVAIFAFLECVVNFCVACYIYTLLIFPFYYK